jgi:cysteine desulfurase / selenocysteine lyase
MLNTEKIRQDFPILKRRVRNDKPLVYLDSAATSQKPLAVIDALTRFYCENNANVHRGIHTLSQEATDLMEAARREVSQFVHAVKSENVIFTRNTTESLNLVAYTWGRQNVQAGDEILLTEMEHHSNLVPWQILAAEKKAV